MKKKAMAAQFTEVTLEDMEKFLKRGFRVLRPSKGSDKGEIYYELKLGPFVGIRVWTSIKPHTGVGADVGADAIRVQLVSLKDHGPLEKGKAPIVKRTQGWRSSLQDKIEELVEKYEDREEFWEQWAGTRQRGAPKKLILDHRETDRMMQQDIEGERLEEEIRQNRDPSRPRPEYQPPQNTNNSNLITPKQAGFIRGLLRGKTNQDWVRLGLERATGFNQIPTQVQLESLSKRQAGTVIDTLLKSQGGRRYAIQTDLE